MRIETRTVYVADDDTAFLSEGSCLVHENAEVFDAMLGQAEYWNADANMHCLQDFAQFRTFVRDNVDWVKQTCLKGL